MAQVVPIREGVFVEDAEGAKLFGNRCKSCGQVFFPKASVCFTCFSKEMEEVVLSRRGKLYTYTIGHMPSTHFQPPYAVGYVEMPEGVRIFAPLKTIEGRPFRVGMEMEVMIDELWQENDRQVMGYKFKPV